MIENELKDEILRAISLTGSSIEDSAVIKPIIGENLSHIVNLSSGAPRIHSNIVKRFKLILTAPLILKRLSPFDIRCCLCKRIIVYPCWYYSIKYVVNQFHYFVCFDRSCSDKVNTKCYKRG